MSRMTLFFHLVGLFSCAGYQVRDGSAQGWSGVGPQDGDRGARGAAIDRRPPPGVAQFPGESRAVRRRRDATPSHR